MRGVDAVRSAPLREQVEPVARAHGAVCRVDRDAAESCVNDVVHRSVVLQDAAAVLLVAADERDAFVCRGVTKGGEVVARVRNAVRSVDGAAVHVRHRGDDVHVPQRVGPRVDVVKDSLLQRRPWLLVELPPLRRDVRGVVRLEF